MRCLVIAGLLALTGEALECQEPQDWLSRFDRSAGEVVLYSPHFDTPPPDFTEPMACPGSAPQLYGFKSDRPESGGGTLKVRLLSYDLNRVVVEPVQWFLRLTHRLSPSGEETLPSTDTWFKYTDDEGLAVFQVPPGVYRIDIPWPGRAGGAGIVRVRDSAADSLTVLVTPGAICD